MTQTSSRQTIVKRERVFKLAIVCGIVGLILAVLLIVPNMMVSFLMAFVIHYLFKPSVNAMERLGASKTLAVLVPFMITGALLTFAIMSVGPRLSSQVETLETEFPQYVSAVTKLIDAQATKLNKFTAKFTTTNAGAWAHKTIENQAGALLSGIPNVLSGLGTILIFSPLLAFFMLRDGREFSRQLLSLVPNNLFELAMNLLYQINNQLGAFIRARLLESLIVGACVWLGLFIYNFPYALILSIIAGVLNLIPYLGPILGAIPGVIVCLVYPEYSLAIVGMVYLIAQVVDTLFIIPMVVAKIVNLHPATVLLCLVVGGYLMGILGMIISVPVTSIVKLTFTEFYKSVVDFRG